METPVLLVLGGPAGTTPLVLDSPHSGFVMPADFGSQLSAQALRDGEDCFIDEMFLPATARGVPLLAAQFPRTYLDPNRHAGDVDLDLLDGPWPDHPSPYRPSGKAALGKALIWRTLDDGRPIYGRKLSVAEVQRRITQYHQPYHATLRRLLDHAHAQFGVVHHFNCHSMNAVSGAMSEGGAGVPRADFVLGDRDGTTCAPEVTAFVREQLQSLGYAVKVNDPFKGVELVRAYANPAAGRHSLQLEINKRLYLQSDPATGRKTGSPPDGAPQKSAGFVRLQRELSDLINRFLLQFTPRSTPSLR